MILYPYFLKIEMAPITVLLLVTVLYDMLDVFFVYSKMYIYFLKLCPDASN